MSKMYLYLARRDKQGVKVITTFEGNCLPARISDIQTLQLPAEATKQIQEIVEENKMHWELWMESANDFKDLRERLTKRGYSSLPLSRGATNMGLSNIKIKSESVAKLNGQRTMMKRPKPT